MITRAIAEDLDRADPLAAFRGRFAIDDAGLYMDGNSLGRPPLATEARVAAALAAWRRDLILAWREWIRVPRRIGDAIATSVLEARAGEVIVGDSTSVNLYKAAAAAIAARPGRTTLITSDDNFPTDLYVLQSLAAQHALRLQVLPRTRCTGSPRRRSPKPSGEDTALVCPLACRLPLRRAARHGRDHADRAWRRARWRCGT
jgi:kynureninase